MNIKEIKTRSGKIIGLTVVGKVEGEPITESFTDVLDRKMQRMNPVPAEELKRKHKEGKLKKSPDGANQ